MRSSRRRQRRLPSRNAVQNAGRRAGIGATGPAIAGTLIVLATLVQQPLTGPLHWAVQILSLLPAALIHCHNRAERYKFTVIEHLAATLGAALVAYLLMVVGLFAGAAATLAVVIAHQTGALTAAASLSSILTLAVALRHRPNPAA